MMSRYLSASCAATPACFNPVRAKGSKRSRAIQNGMPVFHAAKGVDEVRGRRPKGERPDQQADAKTPVLFSPGRHYFHADGVDARQ